MNVLLSGATGLIGQAVEKELIRRGHTVFRLSHRAPKMPDDNVDGVIHLAGEPIADKRWTKKQKEKIRDSRVVGTRTLAQALESRGDKIKIWVQGSAIGFYGDTKDKLVGEVQGPGSDFLAEVVRDWEAEAESFAHKTKTRLVKIRTGIVLSNDSGAFPKLLSIFRKGVGGRLGNGQQFMSWVHINDIANLFAFALESREVSGPINGTAPSPVTNQELTAKLAKAVGKREFFAVPEIALKLALGEMSSALLASTRATSRAAGLGFKFKFENFDAALADLARAWEPHRK